MGTDSFSSLQTTLTCLTQTCCKTKVTHSYFINRFLFKFRLCHCRKAKTNIMQSHPNEFYRIGWVFLCVYSEDKNKTLDFDISPANLFLSSVRLGCGKSEMHFIEIKFPSNSTGILMKEHHSGRIYIKTGATQLFRFFFCSQ